MIYGWLIDWVTDCTVRGLTNWLNDLCLIDWLSNWLYCLGTDQLTEWFPIELSGFWPNDLMINGWLIDWLINSTVRELTNWPNDLWLVDWLTDWPVLLTQAWFYFTEWTTYCLDSTVWVDCMFLLVNFFIYCELCGEVLKSLVLSFNSISCRKNGYKLSAQRFLGPFWWTSVSFYLTMVSKATNNYHELGYKPLHLVFFFKTDTQHCSNTKIDFHFSRNFSWRKEDKN